MAGQYHYLWTGQYDKKWNTTWCIVDQSQDVCDVLYVIILYINTQYFMAISEKHELSYIN